MGGGAYLAEGMIEGGALAYLGLHEAVEDERDEEAHQHHDIELNVHRSAEAVGYVPAEHHEEVGTDDGERGADMREAQLDVEVVEVGLVGVERGLALEQAGTHHAKRVEDGDAQHGEREGDKTEAAIDRKGCRRRGEQRDDEYGEDDAQRERAGIADEHLGLLAEHVVEEEREQRGGNDCGKNDHLEIAQMIEDKAEQSAADDAVARGVAVDTVDEVDGIDDAYAGEDRQGNGDWGGDGIKPPEAVEVIELVTRGADEVEHQQYLHNEPHLGRQRDDVVHEAHDEDDEDAGEDGEQVEVAAKQAVAHDAREHAEDDGKTAHDGNGDTLQLAGIGVVDDVLALGYLEHIRVDPACAVERDERRDQDLKEFVHDCLLFVSHGEDKFRIMGGVSVVDMRSMPPAVRTLVDGAAKELEILHAPPGHHMGAADGFHTAVVHAVHGYGEGAVADMEHHRIGRLAAQQLELVGRLLEGHPVLAHIVEVHTVIVVELLEEDLLQVALEKGADALEQGEGGGHGREELGVMS